MSESNLYGMIGLALKAKHLVPGAVQSLRLIKEGKASLVLLDKNASQNTQKRLADACRFRKVPLQLVQPGLLGAACGKHDMVCAALKQGGFSDRINSILTSDKIMENYPETAEDKG